MRVDTTAASDDEGDRPSVIYPTLSTPSADDAVGVSSSFATPSTPTVRGSTTTTNKNNDDVNTHRIPTYKPTNDTSASGVGSGVRGVGCGVDDSSEGDDVVASGAAPPTILKTGHKLTLLSDAPIIRQPPRPLRINCVGIATPVHMSVCCVCNCAALLPVRTRCCSRMICGECACSGDVVDGVTYCSACSKPSDHMFSTNGHALVWPAVDRLPVEPPTTAIHTGIRPPYEPLCVLCGEGVCERFLEGHVEECGSEIVACQFDGCDDHVRLADYNFHYKRCTHAPDCCVLCEQNFSNSPLVHIRDECTRARVCVPCGAFVKKGHNTHACEDKLIVCPLGCGERILRKDLPTHRYDATHVQAHVDTLLRKVDTLKETVSELTPSTGTSCYGGGRAGVQNRRPFWAPLSSDDEELVQRIVPRATCSVSHNNRKYLEEAARMAVRVDRKWPRLRPAFVGMCNALSAFFAFVVAGGTDWFDGTPKPNYHNHFNTSRVMYFLKAVTGVMVSRLLIDRVLAATPLSSWWYLGCGWAAVVVASARFVHGRRRAFPAFFAFAVLGFVRYFLGGYRVFFPLHLAAELYAVYTAVSARLEMHRNTNFAVVWLFDCIMIGFMDSWFVSRA